jgi:hypothetical protein
VVGLVCVGASFTGASARGGTNGPGDVFVRQSNQVTNLVEAGKVQAACGLLGGMAAEVDGWLAGNQITAIQAARLTLSIENNEAFLGC